MFNLLNMTHIRCLAGIVLTATVLVSNGETYSMATLPEPTINESSASTRPENENAEEKHETNTKEQDENVSPIAGNKIQVNAEITPVCEDGTMANPIFKNRPPVYECKWGDFKLNQEEFELFLTTVFCESGGEKYDTQFAVACTILNRIYGPHHEDDMKGVIYAKNAFSVTKWPNFEERGWTESVKQACLDALEENPFPRDMYYFRINHYHKFGKPYKKIGKVYFSTFD